MRMKLPTNFDLRACSPEVCVDTRRLSAKTMLGVAGAIVGRRRRTMELVAVAQSTPIQEVNLSGDLLRGADEIAVYLYGDAGQRRKVYHLAETSRLPIFRLGSVLCARRSILIAWIAEQERRAWRPVR
jgi:hypothetical protein